MCKFFSFSTKGSKRYYFDWEARKALLKNNPMQYLPDSHSSVCHYHKVNEDKVNKYEYNPLTGKFVVDQINIKDDRVSAERWVRKLDFKTIVEPLIIKPIVHPFEITPPTITDKEIKLLKQWASVWASVRDSVGDSVWDSVGASVRDSVGDSVGAYVGYLFAPVIKEWKYIDHKEGEYPFQPAVDLWMLGLVPSFGGKKCRLHGGEKAGVLWEEKS